MEYNENKIGKRKKFGRKNSMCNMKKGLEYLICLHSLEYERRGLQK
jgi:hypothetical protein